MWGGGPPLARMNSGRKVSYRRVDSWKMLWPLLVEYTEPGAPMTSHLQQQGNMALFLTLFIVTCVEVLIVKVAQSERELEMLLTPHDPSYLSEYADDDDDEDDICRVRSSLSEEELARQKKFLVSSSCLLDSPPFLPARDSASAPNGTIHPQIDRTSQSSAERPLPWDEHPDQNDRKKQGSGSDTVKVRELMEKMVETMIGGPLDGTTVGQLSTHSAYLDMFTKYHNLLCRELARLGFALHLSLVRRTPRPTWPQWLGTKLRNDHPRTLFLYSPYVRSLRVAQLLPSRHSPYISSDKNEDPPDLRDSSLKRLIKQIVDEAMDLPIIKDAGHSPKAPKDTATDDVESKSYEDILATAILNKVIENFQGKSRKDSEAFIGKPKPRVRQRKLRRNDAKDSPRSDGDWSDTSRSDQLSLTIEEYIEEVTTALEVSEDERSDSSDCEASPIRRIPFPESGRTVVDGTDDENSDVGDHSTATELLTSNSSWEENWLFQKKRLRSTPNAHHPVPVPMLVPNPSEDFRALVGGVDADDLSDMSESGDFAFEELIMPAPEPKEVVDEEHVHEDSNKKVNLILTHITEESFLDNLTGSPCEDKDMTNAEVDRSLAQTSEEIDAGEPAEDAWLEDKSEVEEPSLPDRAVEALTSTDSEDSIMRCRVAEREKEKWMHPVPLADNPYSAENIEKREQQRRTNQYFRIGTYTGDSIDFPDYPTSSEDLNRKPSNDRFTRDYYINASKHPSGMSSPPRQLHKRVHCARGGSPDAGLELTGSGMAEDDSNSDLGGRRPVDRSAFSLPCVRELAKQFAAEKPKHPKDGLQTRLESKHKGDCVSADSPLQEAEVDYSTVPVSEIIVNLQQGANPGGREKSKHPIYEHTRPATQMEIFRKVENNLVVENHTESGRRAEEGTKYNGKQVHSLTARSISKEFREGLKKNSYQKVFPKVDRNSSGGESDHGDVVCSRTRPSPTPSVDLKNMKKFWEEIITANSNSTKQK